MLLLADADWANRDCEMGKLLAVTCSQRIYVWLIELSGAFSRLDWTSRTT